MSIVLHGVAAGRGIAIGHAHLVSRGPTEVPQYDVLPEHIPQIEAIERSNSAQSTYDSLSGLFNEEWYLERNKDVAKTKANPIKHYLKFGWREGRNPSPDFDTKKYLEERPDIREAGICPLVHYIKFGIKK